MDHRYRIGRQTEEIRREGRERLVAVAVDNDKSSRLALKWAVDNFITRGQTVRLVHVIQPLIPNPVGINDNSTVAEQQLDNKTKSLFLQLQSFCQIKQIQCEVVLLEDRDVAKALLEYITQYRIQTMLLGAVSKSGISRLFKARDVPSSILRWAPDFCNVHVISNGRAVSVRAATRLVPNNIRGDGSISVPYGPQNSNNEPPSVIENDGSFFYDEVENDMMSSSGTSADSSSFFYFYQSLDLDATASRVTPSTSQSSEDRDAETRRLKIELKQTMDMYHAACREALEAKQKVMELQKWKRKEEKRTREVHLEKSSSSIMEKEKAKYKAIIEAAEASRKYVELQVQKKVEAEIGKALKEAHERKSHKYQSLFHILTVLFLFYFYFSL